MALEHSLSQKLSLSDNSSSNNRTLSPTGFEHSNNTQPRSPSASSTNQEGGCLAVGGSGSTSSTTVCPSPTATTPSGDESSSASSTAKKISFGKVFGKNDQPQNILSPTNESINNAIVSGANNSTSSGRTLCPGGINNNGASGAGGHSPTSSTTPTSPSSRGKSRHSSMSSGGSDKSVRATRKVFNTWRSVCGKKTKDLFKRWKTLPEHHSEFDGIATSPDGGGGGSFQNSSNYNSPSANTPTGRNTPTTGDRVSPIPNPNSATSTVGKLRMLVKKHSQVEIPEPEVGTPKQTGWTVHVWATYVQRGSEEEENEEEKPLGRDFLSEFQKVKLLHFFRHVLDMNHDDVISASDFVALNQRIRHYIEWSSECIEFHILKEVHSGFLECFLNQPLDECSIMYYCHSERETREFVDKQMWLDIWGELLNEKKVLENLPLWLQIFPKILFQVINKSGSGIISREQLRAFYTMFLGIDFRVVNDTLDSIYNAMTDGGKNPITYTLYKLCFSNFLFGKYPHGPGQYLFGICSQESLDCAFPIDYSALNTPKDDLEPYDPAKDKENTNRRSVIV